MDTLTTIKPPLGRIVCGCGENNASTNTYCTGCGRRFTDLQVTPVTTRGAGLLSISWKEILAAAVIAAMFVAALAKFMPRHI